MATAAFLKAWRRSGREPFGLVKVELTDPSARTLYLSTAEVATPGSPPQVWEGVLTKWGPIVAPGSFGSRTIDLCSGTFQLPAAGRLAYQTGAARLSDAFRQYDWQGAKVTFYFWEGTLTDVADLQQQLAGRVQTCPIKDGIITVHVLQQLDDREIPDEVIGTDKWPRAPEKSKGRVPPIDYGRLKALPLRTPPWTAEYGNIATGHNGLQLIAGGRRAVPGVVVDIGRGGDAGGPTKIVFAGHPVKRIGDDTNGTTLWMEQDGKLCRLQPGAQVNNCRCASGVSAITRPSGSFLTDGVHPGALVANVIAASFPANTRITTVAAGSLGTSAPASATVSVDTVGEFLDLFNDATDGAGLLIGDQPSGGTDPFVTMFVPILPSNVELVASNNAENPRAVLDAFNDTNYAVLDYSNNQRELRVRFPSIPEAGDLVSADIEVGVELISGSLTNVKLAVEVNRGGGNYAEITLPTPSPNPGFVGMAFGTGTPPAWGSGGLPANPWQFGDAIARIYFSAAAAGTVLRVYGLGLTLRVRPTREIVAERVTRVPAVVQKRENAPWFITGWNKPYVYTTTELVPGTVPVFGPLVGAFAANLEGWADDGSGTYTGVANAVIERAPDIVRHLLVTYGGFSGADIETGASTFGSLVKLRDSLKTWRQLDMAHAFAVLERTPIQQLIESLASDSLCWFRFNRFDGKLHGTAWRIGLAPDYNHKIRKEWISRGRITIERAPSTEIIVSTRVPYSMDYVGKNMLHEITLGPGRSSSGHRWRGIRDQLMTVIDSGIQQNNKLDFKLSGTDYTATLDAGDYLDPMLLAKDQVAAKMNTAASVSTCIAGYGPRVIAGFNDTIRFGTQASEALGHTGTIAASDYATMEDLAAATAAAMNVAHPGLGYAVSYSRATRRMTYSRSGGGTIYLWWATAATANKRAMAVLGWENADINGASLVSDHEREEQRFHVGNLAAAVDLKWETGSNGLNAGLKNCAALIGFDSVRDLAGSANYLGHSPKGNREILARDARAKHGGRREWSTPGITIQDTDTAREISLRAFDLFSVSRPKITFASGYVPDLERGRVFEFEANVDELGTYDVPGSDGSWAGKSFLVIEAGQDGPPDSLDTQVVAMQV
jgi:hypothetical protein